MSEFATFGPGGNGDLFKDLGYKSTLQAPGWLEKYGLDSYEVECGQGVRGSDESYRQLGEKAKEHHIKMSLHAPYFISLSGQDPEKRLGSLTYIEQSLHAGALCNAEIIVIHSGSCATMDRKDAMNLSLDTLSHVAEKFADTKVKMGIETMGKINQLGTLEEVIQQCKVSPLFAPVVDFGHLNARNLGHYFTDCDSYRFVFDEIGTKLGNEYAKNLHCHFSKIEYTNAGEKKHLTFADTLFGPEFEGLAEAIIKENVAPNIICESAGTQAEDALYMKKTYRNLLK